MSRSIFLALKDDNFWGNENSDEKSETKSTESVKDLEPKKAAVAPVQEKVSSTPPSTPKAKKNPSLTTENNCGGGGFGGCGKTNSISYFKGSPCTPKGQSPFKSKLSYGDAPPSPGAEPPVLYAPPTYPHPAKLSSTEMALYQAVSNGYRLLSSLDKKKKTVCCERRCHALSPKWYSHSNPGSEMYSRKVFVGGLPSDVDEQVPGGLQAIFEEFGKVRLDWPGRLENGASRGYLFLVYQEEASVKRLVQSCQKQEDEKYFLRFSHQNRLYKVQIRAWLLADSDYLVHLDSVVDSKKTIFVGGIPRPLRALELAHIMERLYGPVVAAGIDIDVDYKYPKGTGAGRVVFEHWDSYFRAISDRYTVLSHGEIQKRVELKPYILDEMCCEECQSARAPYFCKHTACLQYYCEKCWDRMHELTEEEHKPYLV